MGNFSTDVEFELCLLPDKYEMYIYWTGGGNNSIGSPVGLFSVPNLNQFS